MYPNLMPVINELPIGLLPIILPDDELPLLIIKAPKEYILTAKINQMFKMYLLPMTVRGISSHGLITAFFDDEDEPLVLKLPLIKDDLVIDLLGLLRVGKFKIHFFDELSRERLLYIANVIIPEETQEKIDKLVLADFSLPFVNEIIERIDLEFGLRTSYDDEKAINIQLGESIYNDGIYIGDLRSSSHSYHGSSGHSHTLLEREEPGSYQEEDIIQCLLMVFKPDQIYWSPKRVYDKEEMCDILVITDKNVLIIQAKDSPNIERINRQKLSRKRKHISSAIRKASGQVKGAINYYNYSPDHLEFLIDSQLHSIDINSLNLKTLIIVKELFDDQFSDYSSMVFDICLSKKAPSILLEYSDFYLFCKSTSTEIEFFETYDSIQSKAIQNRQYSRVRFGLLSKKL